MLFSSSHNNAPEDTDSDAETVSSAGTDVGSRATSADSWYDVKSDPEQQQQIKQLDKIQNDNNKEQTRVDDHYSSTSFNNVHTTDNIKEEINNITSMDNNLHNTPIQIKQEQQVQKEWINPYWDANWKPEEIATQSLNEENKARVGIQRSPSNTDIPQLIPDTILTKDQDKIEAATDKQSNTNANFIASNSSFHLGERDISDESDSEGNIPASTHIRPRIVTTPSESSEQSPNNLDQNRSNSTSHNSTQIQSTLNQQQTLPEKTYPGVTLSTPSHEPTSNPLDNHFTTEKTTILGSSIPSHFTSKETRNQNSSSLLPNNQSQPLLTSNQTSWTNPYWEDDKSQNITSTKKQDNTWQNPYWKDSKLQSSATSQKHQPVTWENPYWKDNKSQISTTLKQNNSVENKPQDNSWQNPYWKDSKLQSSATSQQHQPGTWKNPYWKDNKSQISTTSKQHDNSSQNPYGKDWKPQSSTASQKNQTVTWKNPYWKDNKSQISTTSKQHDNSWKHPYWKDWKPQSSTTSQKNQTVIWENPYWKDNKSQISTAPKQYNPVDNRQQGNSWQSPNSKDQTLSNIVPMSTSKTSNKGIHGIVLNDVWISDNLSPPDHTVPPIPSFYKRIFPVTTPPSSRRPSTTIEENKLESFQETAQPPPSSILNEKYQDYIDDGDILPYTIDNQGILHFRPLPSSSLVTINKTGTFGTSLPSTQNPKILPPISGFVESQQRNAVVSTSFTSNPASSIPVVNNAPSAPITNKALPQSQNSPQSSSFLPISYPSSTQTSAYELTTEELYDIQNILRLLETNPNAIPTVETYQYAPTVNTSKEIGSYSTSGSPLTNNKEQQSIKQPPSSLSYSQNNQSNFNSQQSPPHTSSNNVSYSKLNSNRIGKPGSFVLI